jgi:hypothetical protein
MDQRRPRSATNRAKSSSGARSPATIRIPDRGFHPATTLTRSGGRIAYNVVDSRAAHTPAAPGAVALTEAGDAPMALFAVVGLAMLVSALYRHLRLLTARDRYRQFLRRVHTTTPESWTRWSRRRNLASAPERRIRHSTGLQGRRRGEAKLRRHRVFMASAGSKQSVRRRATYRTAAQTRFTRL